MFSPIEAVKRPNRDFPPKAPTGMLLGMNLANERSA